MKNQSQLAYFLAIGILSSGLVQRASAQQSELVNVELDDVAVEIAQEINVDVGQIPLSVQAPVGVAANVCDISTNDLIAKLQNEETAACNAQSTSPALNQIVQKQIGTQQ